ncbi:hypothetical protein [Pseudomonas baltica]|uniref:hypothetical protein n=1 Tax=Pseudomonas baltica TaxID=2762576 RepID=UPI0028A06CE1|nr:hypothetical protein [Pseudomonas baltica]
MLGRDTEWRQGQMLSEDHVLKLGLALDAAENIKVVVATHDCDLANDHENDIEVLIGIGLDKPEGILENARNPRRLHLTFSTDHGPIYIEVAHSGRRSLSRKDFIASATGASGSPLDSEQKRAFKQWLAARYGRPAFPNSFETRLRTLVGKNPVEKQITKIVTPHAKHLVGVFFDLGEERTEELGEETPYFLSISVLYDANDGGPTAREAAEAAAAALVDLFHNAYGAGENRGAIILERCAAVADTVMTLADLRKVDQWRLEYVSLSESPPGDFVGAGELST